MDEARPQTWHLALLAAAAIAAYANALPANFVYDDHILIEKDARITGRIDVPRIFQTNYWGEAAQDGLYRPLTVLTFALDHALFGKRPLGYHAVNVILHSAAGVALYLLLAHLFLRPTLALTASLLFALHPIHTEAVTGVVGRSEVMAFLFVTISLRLALPPSSLNRLGLSMIFFLLALLSKESAIVLIALYPLALLVAPGRERPLPFVRRWAPLLAMFGVAAFWFAIRFKVIGSVLTPAGYSPDFLVNPLAHEDNVTRWATATAGLGRSLRLLLLPVGLSADYSFHQIPLRHGLAAPTTLLSACAILGMILAGIGLRRRTPAVTFGVAWFLVSLLPTSNLLFPIGSILGERFLYLPSAGFCLLLAVPIDLLRGRRSGRSTAVVCLSAVCLLFAAGTFSRNLDWRNDETLFESVVRNAPRSARGHYELGLIRQDQGRQDEAIRHYWEATRIYPDYVQAHYNRARVYFERGEYDVAVEDYREVIRIRPDWAEAHHNMAICLTRLGYLEPAAQSLRRAIVLDPGLENAFLDLARVLKVMEEPEKAVQVLEAMLERYPDNATGHVLAAQIYHSDLRDRENARVHARKAKELDPMHPGLQDLDSTLFE